MILYSEEVSSSSVRRMMSEDLSSIEGIQHLIVIVWMRAVPFC